MCCWCWVFSVNSTVPHFIQCESSLTFTTSTAKKASANSHFVKRPQTVASGLDRHSEFCTKTRKILGEQALINTKAHKSSEGGENTPQYGRKHFPAPLTTTSTPRRLSTESTTCTAGSSRCDTNVKKRYKYWILKKSSNWLAEVQQRSHMNICCVVHIHKEYWRPQNIHSIKNTFFFSKD